MHIFFVCYKTWHGVLKQEHDILCKYANIRRLRWGLFGLPERLTRPRQGQEQRPRCRKGKLRQRETGRLDDRPQWPSRLRRPVSPLGADQRAYPCG